MVLKHPSKSRSRILLKPHTKMNIQRDSQRELFGGANKPQNGKPHCCSSLISEYGTLQAPPDLSYLLEG
jgi:hypothetical protein